MNLWNAGAIMIEKDLSVTVNVVLHCSVVAQHENDKSCHLGHR